MDSQKVALPTLMAVSVIFFTILTVFIIPDISANSDRIEKLEEKIEEKLDSIEETTEQNKAILCYLSEGVFCG